MDLSVLTNDTILLFLLMLIRISGMMVSAPVFGQAGVPVQLKVGIAVTLSLILFPIYSGHASVPANDLWMFTWLAGQEFIIGLLIGFVANLVFVAVQLAGNQVTLQMGLSTAQEIDPLTNAQQPVLSQFYFILAILLFLNLNLHHYLIMALVKSFQLVPLASGLLNIKLLTIRFMALTTDVFMLSLVLVLPIIGITLVQEIALAMMAKVMPQMNIFMVALPLKVGVVLILISATLPYTTISLNQAFQQLPTHLFALYQQ